MNTEKLEFKLTLCPKKLIAKNKTPEFKIALNDVTYVHSHNLSVETAKDRIEVIVPVELAYGTNKFSLEFLNKALGDSIYEKNEIVDDLYIHITKIEVDNMDITTLAKKLCMYSLNQPVFYNNSWHKEFSQHTFLTWNGIWSFEFQTPFYKWLIDQL